MSDADAAFAAAEAEIARVRAAGETTLNLTGEDFAALTRLPDSIGTLDKLERLVLRVASISDVAPIAGLTGLQSLDLISTQVTDLTPLQGLTGLQRLDLRSTQVSDLTPLQGLTGLQSLTLDSTQVSDLTPLQGLTGLQSLTLVSTQVTDLTPLQGLTGLQRLDLAATPVTDLTPLQGLTGLQSLTLAATQVTDLTPLQGLTGLQSLDLDGTQVTDLRPIRGLTNLIEGAKKGYAGLRFQRTPTTRADPELDRLSMIEDHAERTKATLAYLGTLRDPSPPPETLPQQQPSGRRSGLLADGRIGFVTEPTGALSAAAKRSRDTVLEDLGDALAACKSQDDNIHADLADMLSAYRAALTADPGRPDADAVFRAAKKLRRADRAERQRAAIDAKECFYSADAGTVLQDVVRSHNAFAALVPDLAVLDRAGVDPAERPEADAAEAALPVLDAAVAAKHVFDDSPFVLRQEMRVQAPQTGPEERDQTETLVSLVNLITVLAAVGLAERKNFDPEKVADATKPGKPPSKFMEGAKFTAGATAVTGTPIGAAALISAYEAQLVAFASKMPASETLIALIKYIAALI